MTPLAPLILGLMSHLAARRDGSAIVKACSCRRRYTDAQWARLPGRRPYTMAGRDYEQRDCPCGSSISIELPLWAATEREAVLTGGPLEHLRDAREVV